MTGWSQAKHIGTLWYKFKQVSDGNWEILCSGDPGSLESNSVICHDHYWQNNGRWFVQIRHGNKHLIGKDDLIEGIQRQNERGRLYLTEEEKHELNLIGEEERKLTPREVKKLANYRACKAYGNAGYCGSNQGIEIDDYQRDILNNLVKQYQASTKVLNWRDADNDTASVSESATKTLNWRDTDNDIISLPTNPQTHASNRTRKSTRNTRR